MGDRGDGKKKKRGSASRDTGDHMDKPHLLIVAKAIVSNQFRKVWKIHHSKTRWKGEQSVL